MAEQVTTDPTFHVAAEACRRAHLASDDLELVRHGSNSVYRLPEAKVVVRISKETVFPADVKRQVAVARWLSAAHVPAIRALNVDQPLDISGRLVTLWHSVNEADADDMWQYGSPRQLGEILRQLHSLREPAPPPLPRFDPVTEARRRLDRLGSLEPPTQQALAERYSRVTTDFARLGFELDPGPIHGDANVGNLLLDWSAGAVLADLDGFSTGPREWDLVLTAMYTDLYGWHTEEEYRDFVEAYGWDIRGWDGYPVLRELRELLMVLWLAGQAVDNPDAREELSVRLESLRTGRGREAWRPI